MKNKEKLIEYWTKSSEIDFEAAGDLFKSKKYPHCLFFAHLSVEKLLKALLQEMYSRIYGKVCQDNRGDITLAKEEVIEIIRKYAEGLKEKGINFRKIILFGSYAADNQRRDSDIDIAVISEDFGKDRFEERVLLSKIAYYVDAHIEPHPVSLQEYTEDTWQTLIREIKSKGIEISTPPPRLSPNFI